MALVEVRDYHYDPERIDAYRSWAEEAGRFLRERWDMSGFWLPSGAEPTLSGSDPQQHPHGFPNVTWVLRWDGMDHRDSAWKELWEDPDWNEIWSEHPGFDGYLQMSVRFMEAV
jgi:hypothetical protein